MVCAPYLCAPGEHFAERVAYTLELARAMCACVRTRLLSAGGAGTRLIERVCSK